MLTLQERFRIGPIHNPIRGMLHGSAALVAFALAVHLWQDPACPPSGRVVLVIFALSQFALYTASALYHSLPWDPCWKRRMQRVDHSMIYVKIAGTLTPILWLGLDDWRCSALLAAAWGIALIGSAQKAWWPGVHEKASIPVQFFQACLVLPALGPFTERFSGTPTTMLVIGGALYLVGAVCFVLERPRLWPRVFSFHELFHVLTVAASGWHYAMVLKYLARMG